MARSPGQGGGFGTTANTDGCAVEGCKGEPRPQICPADDRYHGHGAVHYEYCGDHGLQMRKDDWYWVCDEHYAALVAGRARMVASINAQGASLRRAFGGGR